MDAPTQTVDISRDSYGEEDDEVENVPEPWGRLFPLGKAYAAQDFVSDDFSIGRGDTCDYCIESQRAGKKVPHFLTLSKVHFRVFRLQTKSNGTDCAVFIEDKSSNGTYVNGELVGKNKKRVLNSDDEISLSMKKNKAFIFSNCDKSASSETALPQEFREKYTLSKFLGKGACGEVRLAFDKELCQKYAVKSISKKTFSVGAVLGRAALEEVKIMKAISHPCIIRVQDVFDTPTKLFIVLELAEGGELFDRVVEASKFSEELSKFYFYQMMKAIKYLHDRNITHRDIKPENILLASDDEETLIKVTDFGLSKFVGENSLMQTLCGTPSYLAPEVLLTAGTSGYSKAVDLWSAGVILFIMLAGYPPFSDELKEYTLKDQITQGRYTFLKDYWEGVSEEAKDMIKKLLTVNPQKRITVQEALEHPWMQDKDVVNKADLLMGSLDVESALKTGQKRSSPVEDVDKPDRKRPTPCINTTPSPSSSSNSTASHTPSAAATPHICLSTSENSSSDPRPASDITLLLNNQSDE